MKLRLLAVLTVFALILPQLLAQESQWQSLQQIRDGTRIQVVEKSLKSTSGKFVGFSEQELVLRTDSGDLTIPRDRVYRVSIAGKNRKRNVLIGMAVGAAAGAGVGAAARQVVKGAGVIAGPTAVFAGLGAGIGALCPAAKTVYRAEIPRQAAEVKRSPPEP